MNREQDIIKIINQISGKYAPYEVFSDWIKCNALMIAQQTTLFHNDLWQKREKEYMDSIRRYSPEEQKKMIEMFGLLVETAETEMTDILGNIYMKSRMGSKATGQFFTPFHLSELTARTAMQNVIDKFDYNSAIPVNEPSSGGGGMIIAAAKVLKDAGINYQRYMDVVAQDLDWKGVYMTYLQLSLYGIKAIVVQGDTLAEPFDPRTTERSRMLWTPKKAGILL